MDRHAYLDALRQLDAEEVGLQQQADALRTSEQELMLAVDQGRAALANADLMVQQALDVASARTAGALATSARRDLDAIQQALRNVEAALDDLVVKRLPDVDRRRQAAHEKRRQAALAETLLEIPDSTWTVLRRAFVLHTAGRGFSPDAWRQFVALACTGHAPDAAAQGNYFDLLKR